MMGLQYDVAKKWGRWVREGVSNANRETGSSPLRNVYNHRVQRDEVNLGKQAS